MRPTLGRVVIYVRTPGDEYRADIIRVTLRPGALEQGGEDQFDVRLAVDIESREMADSGFILSMWRRWYTPMPVAYDGGEIPKANTWHWPPKV